MKALIKQAIKKILPYPPAPAMSIDNMYAYLDALWHKRHLDGPVVEIGCASGGTTAWACRFLSRIGCRKRYYCFDTFEGFVESQLATDHAHGLTSSHDRMFSSNSVDQFRASLAGWGVSGNLEIVPGDICEVGQARLPHNISVCLLDVDLRDPIYCSLQMLQSRMAPNGIILVDDCKQGTSWVGANIGYTDFVREAGLPARYYMGFGVIEMSAEGEDGVPWPYSATPNAIPQNFYA